MSLSTLSAPLVALAGMLVGVDDADATAPGHAHGGQRPVVHALSETSGSTYGGTRVRITGGHFVDVTAVRFSGVPAASVTVHGTRSLVAYSPANHIGRTHVQVVTRHGTSANIPAARFVYRQFAPIAAGSAHSCDLRVTGGPSGAVRCWGDNSSGQLGTGNHDATDTPVASGRGVAVTAGAEHTCTLGAAGSVRCWGNNAAGQLGNGRTDEATRPVRVTGLTRVVAVDAGWRHTCAVRENGTVWCWGANAAGQLGDGDRHPSPSPVRVHTISTAIGVSAGYQHTCAVLADGGLLCWGSNTWGELGNGQVDIDAAEPVRVGRGYVSVSAGRSATCGAQLDGHTYCWGDNRTGQLGNGSRQEFATAPRQVSGMSRTGEIAAADGFACALNGGQAFCWGDRSHAQLGDASDGSDVPQRTPTAVVGGSAGAIAGGGAHSCLIRIALDPTYTYRYATYCWGDNSAGQLGDGTNEPRNVPVEVS